MHCFRIVVNSGAPRQLATQGSADRQGRCFSAVGQNQSKHFSIAWGVKASKIEFFSITRPGPSKSLHGLVAPSQYDGPQSRTRIIGSALPVLAHFSRQDVSRQKNRAFLMPSSPVSRRNNHFRCQPAKTANKSYDFGCQPAWT